MVVVAALVAQLRAQREAAVVVVVAVRMVAMAVAARHDALMRAVVVERVRAVAAYGERSRADRRQQVCRQQCQGHQGASYGSVAHHCRCVYGTKIQIFCKYAANRPNKLFLLPAAVVLYVCDSH